MLGIIQKTDLLLHPLVVIQCFGMVFLWRTLFAARNQTFLSLVIHHTPPAPPAPDVVERCIQLEQDAKAIYRLFEHRFAREKSVADFFHALADQEQEHAEALELCHIVTKREGWHEETLTLWQDALPELERKMQQAQAAAETITKPRDALLHVIALESSEINQAYLALLYATDAAFVSTFQAFRQATQKHFDYIAKTIPLLDPTLAHACETLRNSLPQGSMT